LVDSVKIDLVNTDIITIPGLKRISYDEIYHPNEAMLNTWKVNRIEIYTLEHSDYGCMISSLDERILWFEHRSDPVKQKITPTSIISFEDLLETCDPRDSATLLFNLDIFVPTTVKDEK
jgi:hypothetical protein